MNTKRILFITILACYLALCAGCGKLVITVPDSIANSLADRISSSSNTNKVSIDNETTNADVIYDDGVTKISGTKVEGCAPKVTNHSGGRSVSYSCSTSSGSSSVNTNINIRN